MEVKLIDWQDDALDLLLYTKATRLQGAQTLEDIRGKSNDWKMEQLGYMRDTIKSSWEFARYVFEIRDVSRAFTHQFVRTRSQAYAQESHRAVDLSDVGYLIPKGLDYSSRSEYESIWRQELDTYHYLVNTKGVPQQDARNLIGTGALTNIIVGTDLRTLHQTAEVRLCVRTQGEYQEVFREMKDAVCVVHPWAEDFIQVFCVNHGTCCFPRYKECPIQHQTIDPELLKITKAVLKEEHAKLNFEANPVARNGSTM